MHPNLDRMKKRCTMLFLTLISVIAVNAQDLVPTDVRITADTSNNAPIGVETSIEVTLTNIDSMSLLAGDTIHLHAMANGEALELEYVLTSDLDSGALLTLNFGAEQVVLIDTSSNFQVIVQVNYAMDVDTTNNTLAEDFIPSPFINNDWACTAVSIAAPIGLDTVDLDNNTNLPPAIETLNIELTNQGDVHYLPWSSISYSVFIGSDSSALHVYLGENGISPGASTLRTLSNQNLMPVIPDSIGVYDLCGLSRQPVDANSANDRFCISIPVVDNFDPTDPFNWPTGEEEVSDIAPYFIQWTGAAATLVVEEAVEYRIYNALGGQLNAGTLHAGYQVRFENLASGVYLLQVKAEDGEFSTEKFVIR